MVEETLVWVGEGGFGSEAKIAYRVMWKHRLGGCSGVVCVIIDVG